MKLEFPPNRFLKYPQILNLVKIRPVGAELFYVDGDTDRWTDRHEEANSQILQFCECA
jgi:hypothetical protein